MRPHNHVVLQKLAVLLIPLNTKVIWNKYGGIKNQQPWQAPADSYLQSVVL